MFCYAYITFIMPDVVVDPIRLQWLLAFMIPLVLSILVADKISRRTLLNRKYSDFSVLLILVTKMYINIEERRAIMMR